MAELHPQIVEKITEQILDLLPHGSGINGDWNVSVTLNENYQYEITASNCFENENDDGKQNDCDFTVRILLVSSIMSIMNKGKYECIDVAINEDDAAECSDILEYLKDTIFQAFE